MTRDDVLALTYLRHVDYINLARSVGFDGDDLRVGIKLTNTNLRTHGDYRWPAPMPGEAAIVTAAGWINDNPESCPWANGDGLCVATTPEHLTSGTVRSIAQGVGLVLVFDHAAARSKEEGKYRCPSVCVVDVFDPITTLRVLGVGANLQYANLRFADLQFADLQYANLQFADLQYANLQFADLQYADLRGARLRGADLRYAIGVPADAKQRGALI